MYDFKPSVAILRQRKGEDTLELKITGLTGLTCCAREGETNVNYEELSTSGIPKTSQGWRDQYKLREILLIKHAEHMPGRARPT